jgi:hypothetical protein
VPIVLWLVVVVGVKGDVRDELCGGRTDDANADVVECCSMADGDGPLSSTRSSRIWYTQYAPTHLNPPPPNVTNNR